MPKCHFRKQRYVSSYKCDFTLMQKSENLSLDQKENFSQRSLVSPRGSREHPPCIQSSARGFGLCLGTRKLPILVSQEELSLEQYSILQSSTSCIYPRLFMHGILKLFMTFFFFLMGGKRKKREFKRENLPKPQTPTELNEPLRVNRT